MGMGSGLSVEEFLNAHFHRTESYPFFNALVADQKEVLDERQYASSAKVFLQPSPACADMWKEARELIPRGTDKDFLIVYVPKGTGQPKMYADTFYGEHIASWATGLLEHNKLHSSTTIKVSPIPKKPVVRKFFH